MARQRHRADQHPRRPAPPRPAPAPPETLAASFDSRSTDKRRDRITSLLETLTTIGLARTGQLDGQTRYFIPR